MLTITTITTKQPKENFNGESDFNIKKQQVQTNNLAVAIWHHGNSRELDVEWWGRNTETLGLTTSITEAR